MRAAVLIVDDEVSILKLFEEILAGLPVEVATATGVEPALALARERGFDLVVSDVFLQEESGFSLLEKLREVAGGPPVVMMSGLWSEGGRRRARALGAAAVWEKPFDPLRVRRDVEGYIREAARAGAGDGGARKE